MGIRITDGRNFTESDERKPNQTIIFNKAAQQQDSIITGDKIDDIEIAGISENFNFQPLQFSINPFAFLIFGEHVWQPLTYMFVKTDGADISSMIAYIKKTMKEFDPDIHHEPNFMDQEIGNLYKKEQNLSTLITLFSLLSVLISIIGVFGLITFETQYRRKEIGVRKVFGATIGEILTMFNKGYIRTVLICFVLAAPAAYYIVKRWQQNYVYQVGIGWWIFAVALVIVLIITVITISVQSYRTANENPVDTIRSGE